MAMVKLASVLREDVIPSIRIEWTLALHDGKNISPMIFDKFYLAYVLR